MFQCLLLSAHLIHSEVLFAMDIPGVRCLSSATSSDRVSRTTSSYKHVIVRYLWCLTLPWYTDQVTSVEALPCTTYTVSRLDAKFKGGLTFGRGAGKRCVTSGYLTLPSAPVSAVSVGGRGQFRWGPRSSGLVAAPKSIMPR